MDELLVDSQSPIQEGHLRFSGSPLASQVLQSVE